MTTEYEGKKKVLTGTWQILAQWVNEKQGKQTSLKIIICNKDCTAASSVRKGKSTTLTAVAGEAEER